MKGKQARISIEAPFPSCFDFPMKRLEMESFRASPAEISWDTVTEVARSHTSDLRPPNITSCNATS